LFYLTGGEGTIVQIDETHFGARRKYNRGRMNPGLDSWVFGGVDTVTKRSFVNIVPNRTRATLLPIIQQRIRAGSTIWSDTWAPYFTLNQHGYQHAMVNHSEQFVTDNGVHTQEIESLWNQIKVEIKIRRGFSLEQLPGVLDEFMYRREFAQQDLFDVFLGHVADTYHVNDY
jgi:transposase-like protein